jgi:hypothetical protein
MTIGKGISDQRFKPFFFGRHGIPPKNEQRASRFTVPTGRDCEVFASSPE